MNPYRRATLKLTVRTVERFPAASVARTRIR